MPNLAQLRWAPPNPFSPYTTTRFPHPLLFRSCNLVPILDAFGSILLVCSRSMKSPRSPKGSRAWILSWSASRHEPLVLIEEIENKIETADALAVKLFQRVNYSVSAMRSTTQSLAEGDFPHISDYLAEKDLRG
ncbi:hypothetical protein BHE74_00005268 [Ensete ventricosum]|nr:hypothetical protein BHE74_00005268 [Ensete ventricosum]